MATCRQEKCGVGMTWALSPRGARIPLDARPYAILARDELLGPKVTKTTRYRVESNWGDGETHAVADPEGTYVSHWVTCADPPPRRK